MDAKDYFVTLAFQYYVAGRQGTFAWLFPVVGNLFHHAVEMFLKAHLTQRFTLREMKNLSHKLQDVWAEFKTDFPHEDLSPFEDLIKRLDRFEKIRYPDNLVLEGACIVMGMNAQPFKSSHPRPNAQYVLFTSEVDELVASLMPLIGVKLQVYMTTREVVVAVAKENKHCHGWFNAMQQAWLNDA